MLSYYESQYLRCVSKHPFFEGGSAEDRCRSLNVGGSTSYSRITFMLWSDERDNDVGSVESLKAPLEIKGLLIS